MNKEYKKEIRMLLMYSEILIKTTFDGEQELIGLYWNLGKLLVDYKDKAKVLYGTHYVKDVANKLTSIYGDQFSLENIQSAIKFYKSLSSGEKTEELMNLTWQDIKTRMKKDSIIAIN